MIENDLPKQMLERVLHVAQLLAGAELRPAEATSTAKIHVNVRTGAGNDVNTNDEIDCQTYLPSTHLNRDKKHNL